jgi:hypothetical protein
MPGRYLIVPALAIVALIAIAASLSLGETPQPPPSKSDNATRFDDTLAFRLDNGALYPGAAWRGIIESKYFLRSREDLLQHVARLPRGATLYYARPPADSGIPTLVPDRDLSWFKAYCRAKGVTLIAQ